ncbi:putative RNA recognition motif domain, nucleotide-binding alpha-beta plait domain superfamily [Helianthus annuus]|nr:putative RNA recognition motif domain, nucleotide-binding alpha-beta plait domain superfamily [Helianthus annuus]
MEMDPGKLFIGGISWDTNEERLRDYFQTFGDVTEAVIMKDRTTGRARGFGFVVFADPVVAERVVKDKHIIDGRTVEAKKAVPRDDQQVELNGKMVEVKRAVPKESSPGPNRSNVGGYNYGLSRVSSYLSSLGGYGLTVDGRYSPVMGRNGLGPSSFNVAPGADANYGGNGNFSSNLGYARSVNSMYSLTPNRLSGPNGYGGGSGGDGNGSVFNSRDIWGGVDHSYAHNSQNSSNYGFGAIWGTPSSVASGSSFIGGGNGVNATAYGRNSGNGTAAAASFGVTDDSGPSFYADPPWRSSSPDLDIPGLFDYGFGSSDGVQKKSVGYVGYSVANRSNTGIAA